MTNDAMTGAPRARVSSASGNDRAGDENAATEDPYAVVRWGDREVRVPARCPHRGAPLAEGTVTGSLLVCPWHQATFDLRTGRLVRGPVCGDIEVTELDNALPHGRDGYAAG
ncbi:Rieske (2Fe-2S) protein [Streptomyces odontomachi]|uniref:Rieske (2Fe-2S) protein n=1 Tax=Streptomyces odontomachi TaxID=2944940 RepID=UPI00210A2784|nr:Rieske 2Fe-2S domain-containing protein [Streptomyces sp. ODS25]